MEKLTPETPKQPLLSRIGGFLLEQARGGGWSNLPQAEAAQPEPFYAAEQHDEWVLCDRPEDGYRKVSGVGIPHRTDGTRPRAV